MPFKKKNNRKHNRIVLCRLVKVKFIPSAPEKRMAHMLNLSESGIKFHVTDLSGEGLQFDTSHDPSSFDVTKLKKGDMLSFCLNLGPEHAEIVIVGQLAWIERDERKAQGLRIRAGAQFMNLSAANRKLIHDYIEEFES